MPNAACCKPSGKGPRSGLPSTRCRSGTGMGVPRPGSAWSGVGMDREWADMARYLAKERRAANDTMRMSLGLWVARGARRFAERGCGRASVGGQESAVRPTRYVRATDHRGLLQALLQPVQQALQGALVGL